MGSFEREKEELLELLQKLADRPGCRTSFRRLAVLSLRKRVQLEQGCLRRHKEELRRIAG